MAFCVDSRPEPVRNQAPPPGGCLSAQIPGYELMAYEDDAQAVRIVRVWFSKPNQAVRITGGYARHSAIALVKAIHQIAPPIRPWTVRNHRNGCGEDKSDTP